MRSRSLASACSQKEGRGRRGGEEGAAGGTKGGGEGTAGGTETGSGRGEHGEGGDWGEHGEDGGWHRAWRSPMAVNVSPLPRWQLSPWVDRAAARC
jgi:hypothetical protein